MKKNIVKCSFILLSILVLSGCTLKDEKIKAVEQSEKEKNEIITKNDLIKKYNPIIFEDEKFRFSKDIQDKINKNFLLSVDVMDIGDLYDNDNKHFVKLLVNWGYSSCTFEVNDEQLNFIRDVVKKDDVSDNFFMVVKIDKVSKLIIPDITANIDDENGTAIYVESSDNFLFEGKLIDIQKY